MIPKVTNALAIFLAVCSILGYILIFTHGGSNTNSLDVQIDNTPSVSDRNFDDFNENYY